MMIKKWVPTLATLVVSAVIVGWGVWATNAEQVNVRPEYAPVASVLPELPYGARFAPVDVSPVYPGHAEDDPCTGESDGRYWSGRVTVSARDGGPDSDADIAASSVVVCLPPGDPLDGAVDPYTAKLYPVVAGLVWATW